MAETDTLWKIALAAVRPVRMRVANMIARAMLNAADDTQEMQLVQIEVLKGETRNGVERFQDYGFTSVPEQGAEAVVAFVDGDRGHGLVIKIDDRRYRLTGLQVSEVALYHKSGSHVLLKQDGSIELNSAAGKDIRLNGGTMPVARVGDTAGPYPIVGGASHVKA